MPPTRPAATIESVTVPAEVAHDRALGAGWNVQNHKRRFADAIAAVIAALKHAEPRLTELDSVVGDGDIGISLSRGARAIEDLTPHLDMGHPAAALRDVSAALRRALGGTSGPLYAVFVLRIATSLAEERDPGEPAAWGRAFRAGVAGIELLGGGKAGDRTMLDALLPTADAIERAVDRGDDVATILHAAGEAAEQGVEATQEMRPRLGRSSYVGDRALGHPDPGAYAVALWLRAIAAAF
jgi:dihydroxyacetone kinase